VLYPLLNQKFVLEKVKKAKEYAENNLTAEKNSPDNRRQDN